MNISTKSRVFVEKKMQLLAFLLATFVATLPAVHASELLPDQVMLTETTLPRIGQGVATYLWFDVYDAALYAPAGTSVSNILSPEMPKVLVLSYRHAVKVEDIDKASWQTLNKQLSAKALAAIEPKVDAMQSTMKNVNPGDRYTLTWQPESTGKSAELSLKLNENTLFTSPDAALAKAYFGIWLGSPPLSDKLKKALLGGQS